MLRVHATCVELDGVGLLLRGPPGVGKSDLALRLIDAGAALVADDQVELRANDGRLWASAPAALAGLLEVRGVGLLRLGAKPEAIVRLAIDLVPDAEVVRLPETDRLVLLAIALPLYRLCSWQASAPAKVRLLVRDCYQGIVEP
jgi:serine kinase of HPr protein (carbohydrate metabolism regulator)